MSLPTLSAGSILFGVTVPVLARSNAVATTGIVSRSVMSRPVSATAGLRPSTSTDSDSQVRRRNGTSYVALRLTVTSRGRF